MAVCKLKILCECTQPVHNSCGCCCWRCWQRCDWKNVFFYGGKIFSFIHCDMAPLWFGKYIFFSSSNFPSNSILCGIIVAFVVFISSHSLVSVRTHRRLDDDGRCDGSVFFGPNYYHISEQQQHPLMFLHDWKCHQNTRIKFTQIVFGSCDDDRAFGLSSHKNVVEQCFWVDFSFFFLVNSCLAQSTSTERNRNKNKNDKHPCTWTMYIADESFHCSVCELVRWVVVRAFIRLWIRSVCRCAYSFLGNFNMKNFCHNIFPRRNNIDGGDTLHCIWTSA